MAYGVALRVWGEYACFTRPELKAERVSYDVITPSAARGILEAIHWKPAIRWVIDRIHVLHPIRFETVCRNEVGTKARMRALAGAMRHGTTKAVPLLVEDERLSRARPRRAAPRRSTGRAPRHPAPPPRARRERGPSLRAALARRHLRWARPQAARSLDRSAPRARTLAHTTVGTASPARDSAGTTQRAHSPGTWAQGNRT